MAELNGLTFSRFTPGPIFFTLSYPRILDQEWKFGNTENKQTQEKKMEMPKEAYTAVKKLLKADPEDRGFIIFSGKNEMEYVQFMIEENGLLLNWPILKKVPARNAKIAELACRELIRKDYDRRNISEIDRTAVLTLKEKEFMLDSEDLYANPGKDPEEIISLVSHLFINVFDYQKLDKIEIELVLEQ